MPVPADEAMQADWEALSDTAFESFREDHDRALAEARKAYADPGFKQEHAYARLAASSLLAIRIARAMHKRIVDLEEELTRP